MILDANGNQIVSTMSDGRKVEKATRMATSVEQWPYTGGRRNTSRGITVYNAFELMGASGFTKSNEQVTVQYQMPIFLLTVSERIDIARMCSEVFGVVTNRMNRVSGMEWCVTKASKEEDRIVDGLRQLKALHDEYVGQTGARALGIRVKCAAEIIRRLPDVRRDLDNFDASLRRWSKRVKNLKEDGCTKVEDWLRHPNAEDDFEALTKKLVFDMLVHGAAVPYKEELNGIVENVYSLPGGTVYPVKGRFVGEATGYIQLVDNAEPQVFFRDEVSFLRYAPRSDSSYGLVPLEAVVNNVAESLMFNQRAAEMADGTRPPEKLVLFGERSPFGPIGEEFEVPVDGEEVRRLEAVVNEYRKDAVRVITGYGTPAVVDVSRADTFQAQTERQRMMREVVGLVFGASSQEMNLTGSESTSGRSTSEAQERSDMYRGVYPIVQALENFWTHDVLPFRFGEGFEFQYKPGQTDEARMAALKAKKDTGVYTLNEIRTDEGMDPIKGDEFDRPAGAAPAAPPPQQQPDAGGLF